MTEHTADAHPADAAKTQLMRSAEFRRGRESGWRRLDAIVTRIEQDGIRSLSSREAQELPILYRSTVSSLSVARAIALDRNLRLYLENLSLRAYLAVYGPRTGMAERIRAFATKGFPRAVREIRYHLLAATIILMAGLFAGYAMVWNDIDAYLMLVPSDLAGKRGPTSTAGELLADGLFAPYPGFVNSFLVFANTLFRNNALVGILSFGLSFAMGLPTLALLAYNGMMVGAFIALHAHKGLTYDCIGWLSIHGVTEILAILLCGAAGFAIAEKIVFPGRLSRLDNLVIQGRRSAGVVAGAVCMLFIAGILEGGFRQLVSNTEARYAIAVLTGSCWWLYFSRTGKAGAHGDD